MLVIQFSQKKVQGWMEIDDRDGSMILKVLRNVAIKIVSVLATESGLR